MRPLKHHGRYDYSAVTRRRDYSWPGDGRLAVYIGLNLEHFDFGQGLGAKLGPSTPKPDVLNWFWCEVGFDLPSVVFKPSDNPLSVVGKGFPGMARRGLRRGARLAGICALSLVLGACSLFLSSATQGMAEDLASAIRNQDDPQTVRDGAPAYLLLIDSLIAGDPGDVDLLLAGAKLYGSYATVFVTDAARAGRLTDKAWAMSREALCRARGALRLASPAVRGVHCRVAARDAVGCRAALHLCLDLGGPWRSSNARATSSWGFPSSPGGSSRNCAA